MSDEVKSCEICQDLDKRVKVHGKSIDKLETNQGWMITFFVAFVAITSFVFIGMILPFMNQAPKEKADTIKRQTDIKEEIINKINELKFKIEKSKSIQLYTPEDNIEFYTMMLKREKRKKKKKEREGEEL